MKENKIVYIGHFSNFGWTPERKNADVLWLKGKRLEALKLQLNLCDCQSSVLNNIYGEWSKPDNVGIIGTTGEKKPIYAIKFSCNNLFDIYYRVCLNNEGWTEFCSNGEICGNNGKNAECYIEGIQIFVKTKGESVEKYIEQANQKLNRFEIIRKSLFIEESERFLLTCTKDYHLDKEISVTEISKGYVLPLKKTGAEVLDGMFVGGVCDEYGNFIAGHDRQNGNNFNLSCLGAYKVLEDEIAYLDESVIFGGIYMKPFGHLFTECLSRLWYVIENSDNKDRIAILALPGQEDFMRDFFEILGIDERRILLITCPTRFKSIKVPDATIRLWGNYYDKYISIYDRMIENVVPASYKKIFLTRTMYGRPDSVNEKWFDDFFEKKGYKLIAPEQYSLKEQIAILAGADEVICTEGTLSHLVLFVKPTTKFVIFRRDHKNILIPQYILNQAREINVEYVDVTYNLLPTKHVNGCFLYGPTKHFIEFLKSSRISFTDEEVEFDLSKYLYEYMKLWCNNFNNKRQFGLIAEVDLFDFLERMNRVFNLPQINRMQYVTKPKLNEIELRKLREENKRLLNEKQ